MKPSISYFICGGHGSTVCQKAWTSDYQTNLFIGVVDNGGNTGLMGRVYRKLNKKYIPLGDLRNIWGELHKDSSIGGLIQFRISHNEETQQILIDKLLVLRDLLNIQNEITDNNITEFIKEYLDGYQKLNDSEKRDLKFQNGEFISGDLIKHNIGNLFLTALIHISTSQNNKDGYEEINTFLHNFNIFPPYINVFLMYKEALELAIESDDKQVVLIGEDKIDLIDFAINPKNYSLRKDGKKIDPKNKGIEEILKNSDLIVVPPGSESNIYPWVQIYRNVLATKKIVKIVNLTDTRVSAGIVDEIIFLEDLGLKMVYLYPKTFNEIRTQIGDDAYSDLLTKYLVQGKRPNDLSVSSIILKLSTISQFSKDRIAEIKSRLLSIVEVNVYSSSRDSIDELKAYREDDPFIAKRGFRHDPKQVGLLINHFVENSKVTS